MRRSAVLSLITLAAIAASRTANAGITYTLSTVGFTGGIYSGLANASYDSLGNINASGSAYGTSAILNGSIDDNTAYFGVASWYYNAATKTTTQIGLTGTDGSIYLNNYGYTYDYSPQSSTSGISATGFTAGVSQRFAGSTSLGYDAWVYSPSTGTIKIPLPAVPAYDPVGSFYTKSVSGGIYNGFSTISGVSNTGQVAGSLIRYDDTGTFIGTDLFYYDPAANATSIIGLSNANNASGDGSSTSYISAIGVNGQVMGLATHYTGGFGVGQTGNDVWYYSPTSKSSFVINLTDVASSGVIGHVAPNGTVSNSALSKVNALGQVLGSSARYDSNNATQGADVFLYDPTLGTPTIVGLTGAGYISSNGLQSNTAVALSDGGQAVGYANRWNTTGTTALGQDAWVYNSQVSSPKSVAIALTGGIYRNNTIAAGDSHSSRASQVNTVGQVAGVSSRYTATGGSMGTDAWYYDPATYNAANAIQTPVRIGLIGGNFEETSGTVGLRSSTISLMNNTGAVAGYSTRYSGSTSVGQEAWVAENGTTYDVTASVAPTDTTQYFYSIITAMNDAGIAVGYYSNASSKNFTNETPFAWSFATGFVNLPLSVSPDSLAAWADLASSLKITTNGTIFGVGQLAGSSGDSTAEFMLTPVAVPEPASLTLLAGGLLLLRRRRTA